MYVRILAYPQTIIMNAITSAAEMMAAVYGNTGPGLDELLSSSTGKETANSCPSMVIVGYSSLKSFAMNSSIKTVAVTEPSSEAWASVEENITVPLEQVEVELWNLVLFTGQSQNSCISPKMATSIISNLSSFTKCYTTVNLLVYNSFSAVAIHAGIHRLLILKLLNILN